MTGKNGIWLKKTRIFGASSFNRDIAVFLFFLFLSFTFWYLNSLRKEFETDLKYPVKYVNPPAGRVIDCELPLKLNLYLKGPGYSIIKLKISGNRNPLIIDFSKITYKSITGSRVSEYYVVTGTLIQNFSKQLRSDSQIQSIKPDTLFVKFGKKATPETTVAKSTLKKHIK